MSASAAILLRRHARHRPMPQRRARKPDALLDVAPDFRIVARSRCVIDEQEMLDAMAEADRGESVLALWWAVNRRRG